MAKSTQQGGNMDFLDELTKLVFLEDTPEKSDIIFIPGGSYGTLAHTAAKLYMEGYAPYILPSGKYSKTVGHFEGSKDEPPIFSDRTFATEWEFLKAILLADGVDSASVLKEDQATYTYENAIYSRQVTDRLGLHIRQAIICCQAYHARRCRLYYEVLYPETRFLICPTITRGISKDNWFLDKDKISTVLGEISRIGGQFHQIVHQYGAKKEEIPQGDTQMAKRQA